MIVISFYKLFFNTIISAIFEKLKNAVVIHNFFTWLWIHLIFTLSDLFGKLTISIISFDILLMHFLWFNKEVS